MRLQRRQRIFGMEKVCSLAALAAPGAESGESGAAERVAHVLTCVRRKQDGVLTAVRAQANVISDGERAMRRLFA